jgi:putative tricarboxylic transport membrane protein
MDMFLGKILMPGIGRVACALTLLGLGFGSSAHAQPGWKPSKTIEIVVPSAPGGGLDLTGRTLQRALQEGKFTDQPVVVVNKPGGSGTIGVTYMNQHRGDAHYVTVQALPIITDNVIGTSPIGVKDITPVAVLVTEQIIFSVAADSPIKDGRDLLARLKNDPASVSIAVSSTPGGQSHLATALLAKAAGGDPKKLKVVFFKSGGEAVTALMGGHVMVSVTPAATILGPRQAGKLRVVGIPAEARVSGPLADVPTWKEQGADVVFSTWRAILGAKGLTPNELAWWDATLTNATSTPEWAQAVDRNQWSADYKNSKETAAFFASEQERLTSLLTELGLVKK